MYQSSVDAASSQPHVPVAPDGTTSAAAPIATAHPATGADAPARTFVAELAHAMQAVAEHQHEATNAELRAATTTHLEHVRQRAAAEAEELRRKARQDIDAVNAWQVAEAERIRAEAARRIAVRGEELEGHLVRHAALIDREIDHIEGVVADYQLQLDDYFQRLTTEPNPGVIARLADQMPDPPDLARAGGDARERALADMAVDPDGDSSPSAPEVVAVMDPEVTPAATSIEGATGSNDDSEEHGNPAIRILRSIATRAAPATEVKAAGTTDNTPGWPPNGSSDHTSYGPSDDSSGADLASEALPEAVEYRSE
jgi:hypothetical protein